MKVWMLILASVFLAACHSVERNAPPVSAPIIDAGAKSGADAALLERGRELYIGPRCTECHHAEPVKRGSWREWDHEILPEMFKNAELNRDEQAAVRAYVLAARDAIKSGALKKKS